MSNVKGFFLLTLSRKNGWPNGRIPIDIIHRYVKPYANGFVSPSQIACFTWRQVADLLSNVGVKLPRALSEAEAIEIYDMGGHYKCKDHARSDCHICTDRLIHYRISPLETAAQKEEGHSTRHHRLFTDTPNKDKFNRFSLEIYPNGLTRADLFFYNTTDYIQISYVKQVYDEELRSNRWTITPVEEWIADYDSRPRC